MRTTSGKPVPRAVYATICGVYGWGILAAWIAFSGSAGGMYVLAVATLLFVAALCLTGTLAHISPRHAPRLPRLWRERRDYVVRTLTGRMSLPAAAAEILLPAFTVAVGFTALGIVFLSVSASA